MGIDILEPIHTIRTMFSSLSLRRSHKRHSVQERNTVYETYSPSISTVTLASTPSMLDITIDHLDDPDLFTPECELYQNCEFAYEGEFYNDFKSGQDLLCKVRVENKQFKVHQFILERDDSQFFKRTKKVSKSKTAKDETPIFVISDTVEQFRDFLRVLYSLPNHLPKLEIDENSIRKLPHLLNVAELAHKYCFSSFELWAAEHIHSIIADSGFYIPSPGFSLGHSTTGDLEPDCLVTRILEFSITANHTDIRDILLQKLMTRILWYDYSAGPRLLKFIEKYTPQHPILCRLRGIVNYRRLVDLESASSFQDDMHRHTQPQFPTSMDVETRMKFLAAHHSLTTIWDRLSAHPPPLPSARTYDARHGKYHAPANSPHTQCLDNWAELWTAAFHRTDTHSGIGHHHTSSTTSLSLSTCSHSTEHEILALPIESTRASSSTAVLRKLKQTMLILRKATANSSDVCVKCSLGGLEALALIRDEIIDSLDDMFVYSPWRT